MISPGTCWLHPLKPPCFLLPLKNLPRAQSQQEAVNTGLNVTLRSELEEAVLEEPYGQIFMFTLSNEVEPWRRRRWCETELIQFTPSHRGHKGCFWKKADGENRGRQWGGHKKKTLIKCSGVKDIQSLKAVLRRQNSGEEQEKGRVGRVGSSSQTTKNFSWGRKRRRRRDVDLRAQIFKLLDKHIYEKSQTLRSQFILSDNVFSSSPGPFGSEGCHGCGRPGCASFC